MQRFYSHVQGLDLNENVPRLLGWWYHWSCRVGRKNRRLVLRYSLNNVIQLQHQVIAKVIQFQIIRIKA